MILLCCHSKQVDVFMLLMKQYRGLEKIHEPNYEADAEIVLHHQDNYSDLGRSCGP